MNYTRLQKPSGPKLAQPNLTDDECNTHGIGVNEVCEGTGVDEPVPRQLKPVKNGG
jgi:hypothetical protein